MQTRKHELRFICVFFTLIISFFIFIFKLTFIQLYRSAHLTSLADQQQNHLVEIEPFRGSILDRRLRPLAINVPVYSLYANPRVMTENDKRKTALQLSPFINLSPQEILAMLEKKKYFLWLKRKLPLEIVKKVKAYNIKGIDFIKESKRYYPNGKIGAHIIGFAGIDNAGLEGTELFYDKYLEGSKGQALILRDARHNELMLEKDFIASKDGLDLVLTIDETIQYIAERALGNAIQKFHAKAGTVIVVDTQSGELLALANWPTYDLQNLGQSNTESRTNRAISYVYEPGSVFKIVTAAAAMEEGKFKETDKIFCENGEYRVANHILHDHQKYGTLTFREVFEKSSNIGVAKIAQTLGPQTIYNYAHKFRFGMKTDIDLRGEIFGHLKTPREWSKTTIGAIPMGQEVTVTPLQLVYAMAAVANDGLYMKPFVVKYIKDNNNQIIKSIQPQVLDQVINEETAQRLKSILVGVVENGTGTLAKIKGVQVAGKTGTAQKITNGQYSHSEFYATFLGFAPADHPRLAAIVVLDDPHPLYYGGTVSAPVFKEVVESSLKYLETSAELTDYKLTRWTP